MYCQKGNVWNYDTNNGILEFLIENQVQFYIPKPEEDVCDLVCNFLFEQKKNCQIKAKSKIIFKEIPLHYNV